MREVATMAMSNPTNNKSGRETAPPHLDVDPFSIEFFDDPYPTHELLRETGPLVYLDKWKIFAVARYEQVHAVLHDPLTFCSSRGAGINDFAREKPWRPPTPEPARCSARCCRRP